MRHGGSLAEPVAGRQRARLQIEINGIQKHLLVEHGLDPASPDNRIIGAALGQAEHGPTTMVSNDAALRIKAAHLGVDAAEHRRSARRTDRHAAVGWSTIETGLRGRRLPVRRRRARRRRGRRQRRAVGENEFAVLRAGSQSALTRRVGDEFELLSHTAPEAWGLRARSKEQRFALELLLDPAIEVVALDGRAGTGKTLLADRRRRSSRSSSRAATSASPSTARWCRSAGPTSGSCPAGSTRSSTRGCRRSTTPSSPSPTSSRTPTPGGLIDELTDRGKLSLESVTFLRGRSLQRQIVVIDEAQNLEPTTLRTILTRVGEGTKVVFTGDTSQIDAPYLGESNNALAVLTQPFGGQRASATSR